jgi:nucleoside-diphosphate-sugar epimerase
MTKTVLVTGASGFIGEFVVPALANEGWRVRAAVRNPQSVPAIRNVEIVAMPDLKGAIDWTSLLDGVSHVVHLAGIAHSPGMLPDDVYSRINAQSVGALAKAAKGRIERLVLMSSVRAQAGLSSDHVITEADAPKPTDAYGRSKLEAERLVAESGVAFTVLRPAVVYGPGVKGNISSLATLARTPMPLPFGALNNRRSLLAIENLASAISLVLNSEQALGETFLVADREPISVGDMVAAMREGLGRSPHLVRVPEGAVRRLMASFGKEAEWERLSGNFVIDAAKLRGLGWNPLVTSREGLARMMRGPANGASAA